MPILGEEVYEKEDPSMAETFSKNNFYIAPKDDVDGNSALLFAIQLFYKIAQNKKTVFDAYCSVKRIARETDLFDFFQ